MKSLSKAEFPMLPSRFLENPLVPALSVAGSAPAEARALRLLRPADSSLRMMLRLVAGFFFFTFGYVKLFDTIALGTTAVSLPTGPTGFALYLEAVGVPFPLLNAYMVCLVEMLCGVGLVLSPFLPASALLTRLCALPLTGDMIVALVTVGVPNLMGNPVLLNGVPVTTQFWRFPLELMLLLISMLLLWRPLASRYLVAHSWPFTARAWKMLPGMR
ncbi:DoxX family protein [Hyalangium sp.]|uniref:DoxX family protein n=1 Tax=Hyalangium sp. TaxID=2028555 RepID=UPI002D619C22|nr:DoxX family protein [Hyalangium sp.]HYH99714.1 DoxX family protein [Hyalangium sp.]